MRQNDREEGKEDKGEKERNSIHTMEREGIKLKKIAVYRLGLSQLRIINMKQISN